MTSKKEWSFSELLTTAPLFNSAKVTAIGSVKSGEKPSVSVPSFLSMYCRQCDHVTRWNLVGESAMMPALPSYRCANCPSKPLEVVFALRWNVEYRLEDVEVETLTTHSTPGHSVRGSQTMTRQRADGSVTKFGQLPPPSDRISPRLEKQLGPEHSQLFKTALRLRNHGLGIGSIAYLRRVVEDTARELVDIVVQEARLEGLDVDPDELARAQSGRDVSVLIDLARHVLPERLKPGGHNPLDRIYEVASASLHGRSDEDCVAAFDDCRGVFEYFFEELPARHERDVAFRAAVSQTKA